MYVNLCKGSNDNFMTKKTTKKPGAKQPAKPPVKKAGSRKRSRKSDSKQKTRPKLESRVRNRKKGLLTDPEARQEAKKYDNPIASRNFLQKLIREQNAMNLSEMFELLNMDTAEQQEALRRRLGAMVRDGQLVQNRRGGYLSVEEADLLRGHVIAHPDGFGFLVPEEGGGDLFLSARQMRTLLHGDRAVVKVSGIDRRGRREGSVISVFERANKYIVGRLFNENGVAFVVADSKRITQDILLPPEGIGGAKQGQIVKVEITQQPTFKSQPIGRVVEVLGDHMAPGMEIDIAIHNYGLPYEWPDEVVKEASKLGDKVRDKDKAGRVDLRATPLVTIDGADARDFDDAVFCEPMKKGWRRKKGWRLRAAQFCAGQKCLRPRDLGLFSRPGNPDVAGRNFQWPVFAQPGC